MKLMYKIFNKDIVFFTILSSRSKKNIIYFIILFFIFIKYCVKIEKLILFLFILFAILLWKIMIEIVSYFLNNNNKLIIFIRKYETIFSYILKILLFIQKWKNPILLLLLYIDKLIFKIIRDLIYIFKVKYKQELTDNQLTRVFFIYYLIINILVGPLKLFFGFYYTILNRIMEMPFSLYFIIRCIGFIISVLIISNILNILYVNLGFLQLFMLIYILLIIISMIAYYLDREFKYFKIWYIKTFNSTDYIILSRNYHTFCGLFIIIISTCSINLIERKYLDITSSWLKIVLEEGFYKYWEYYKRNTCLNTISLWKEIKKRPSYYWYLVLIGWINLLPTRVLYAPNGILYIIYNIYKKQDRTFRIKNTKRYRRWYRIFI